MKDPKWLEEARKYIGQHEVVGSKHSPFVLRLWQLIRAPFKDDETPWCAGFVGGMLELSGIPNAGGAWARGYLKQGVKLSKPAYGCIVVFERGPTSGHVGFVVGQDASGRLMVLGGNQGNAVNIKPFPKSRVLGYRWPGVMPLPERYNLPTLDSRGMALSSNEA